jgi:hypothetical protein
MIKTATFKSDLSMRNIFHSSFFNTSIEVLLVFFIFIYISLMGIPVNVAILEK